MRISELSATTGVPVPTIKYYLRERLLPEGERSSPNQASYGEVHVKRLGVIRALVSAGVSIAGVRRVVQTLEDPPTSAHRLLGSAHAAIAPSADNDLDLAPAADLARQLGWEPVDCEEPVLHAVARALDGLKAAGFEVAPELMATYLRAMREIADAEIADVPTDSPEAAVRHVVLGSVLVEPLLLALRRVAQQVASATRFGERTL